LEAIAHTRKAEIFFNEKGSSEMDLEQIRILREEKQALELDNTNLKDELNQRFNELETANKSIADKERALRHINKDIQHRDG
jgi:regulator of replication initiation timing